MCKFDKKNDARRIDPCMKNIISFLQKFKVITKGCCCGHGKYPATIIVDLNGTPYEIMHNIFLSRNKRFYVKDKQGYYFIPEVVNKENK